MLAHNSCVLHNRRREPQYRVHDWQYYQVLVNTFVLSCKSKVGFITRQPLIKKNKLYTILNNLFEVHSFIISLKISVLKVCIHIILFFIHLFKRTSTGIHESIMLSIKGRKVIRVAYWSLYIWSMYVVARRPTRLARCPGR